MHETTGTIGCEFEEERSDSAIAKIAKVDKQLRFLSDIIIQVDMEILSVHWCSPMYGKSVKLVHPDTSWNQDKSKEIAAAAIHCGQEGGYYRDCLSILPI